MRIHITTVAPEEAAIEIMQHMESRGGEWIVNAVEDEGYVMARIGTLDGKRLERSLSPCLCGPFDARWSLATMTIDLRAARAIGYGVKSSLKRPAEPRRSHLGRPPGGHISPTHETLKRLEQRNWTVSELAADLNITRRSAQNAVQKLLRSNRAKLVERRPFCGGWMGVYGAAA
jgi:hypothetical protein